MSKTDKPKKTYNNFSFLKEKVEQPEFIKVTGSVISFTIQDGPIKEFGVNGCQIDDIGRVWQEILRHFNKGKYACSENSNSIRKIEEALFWQGKRKKDRIKRNVEGWDKK